MPTKPLAGDVHVNRPLTNFGQKYLQDPAAFVGGVACPRIGVSKKTDLFWEYNRDDFWRDEVEERAEGTESSGGSFSLSTVPYTAKKYSHHKDVTDDARANQDEGINLDEVATQYVTEKLNIKREVLFASAFMGTSIWTTDFSPGTKWESSTSTPIAEFQTGKRTVQLATGKRPNRAVFGRQAYDTLINNDDILSRITGGATTNLPAMVMRQLLAQILELESIYVMDAIKTTSTKGAASTTRAFIGSADDVLLYYAPATLGWGEPTAMARFAWTGLSGMTPDGFRMKRWYMQEIESTRVEGDMAFVYQKIAADLGYYINNVTT